MKKISLLILFLFSSQFICSATVVYEIDFMYYAKFYPDSGNDTNTIEYYLSSAEKAKDQDVKEKLLNNATNTINADIYGYEYNIPFCGFIVLEDNKITKYRFEGILPGVDASSEKVYSTPKINYSLHVMEFYNGKDFYQELYDINTPENITRVVYRDDDFISSNCIGLWRNYLLKCIRFDNLISQIDAGSLKLVDGSIVEVYRIDDKTEFHLLQDRSEAFIIRDKMGTKKMTSKWNRIKEKHDLLIPEIEFYTEIGEQIIQIISVEKKDYDNDYDNLF